MASRSQPQPDRDDRDRDAAVLRFVEKFALILTNAGMPRMPARVFSALLVADGGMTAAGLADRLRISAAAVSGAVRYLTQVNMVERGRTPGERRDHYFVRDDTWYSTVTERDQLYQALCDVLDEGTGAVGTDTACGRRLAEIRDFFKFLAEEMPLLVERWREQQRSARS